MKIAGYLKTSLIEWPGKISSVIFVPGCNFRCPFCHNRDLVEPERIKGLQDYSEQSVLTDLKRRKKWIDGAVVTGGEPTLQKDLPEFLKKIKKMGFETMIETNGSRPEAIVILLSRYLVNCLTLDFKAPLDQSYAQAVGLKNFDPKIWPESLKLILKSKIPFELRTTVVPGIHDEKVLTQMAKQLKKLATRNPQPINWFIQTFQPKNCLEPKFQKIKPFSRSEMEQFVNSVKKIIPSVALRQ